MWHAIKWTPHCILIVYIPKWKPTCKERPGQSQTVFQWQNGASLPPQSHCNSLIILKCCSWRIGALRSDLRWFYRSKEESVEIADLVWIQPPIACKRIIHNKLNGPTPQTFHQQVHPTSLESTKSFMKQSCSLVFFTISDHGLYLLILSAQWETLFWYEMFSSVRERFLIFKMEKLDPSLLAQCILHSLSGCPLWRMVHCKRVSSVTHSAITFMWP